MPPVLRFAPSPNGELHLGHALSALVGYRWARRLGGRFLVRIEDIDTARSRPEYIASAFEDLAWLGIEWEQPALRQSEHFADYTDAAARLESIGLLYPCFASRSELARASKSSGLGADPDGVPLYPDLYKSLPPALAAERRASGEPYALRLRMDRAVALARQRLGGRPLTFHEFDEDGVITRVTADPTRWGDAVIVRKDTPTSYHLSVVVDDARQCITHVTRGGDLYASTDLQRLLQVLLEQPEWQDGPLYHHHRLVTDESGRKLAKSAGDTSLRSLRGRGWTLNDVHDALQLSATVAVEQSSPSR